VSNVIFPAPVAQSWGVTWPIKKSPSYKTLQQTPANNRGEVRISLTPYPIWVWELDLDYLKGDMSTGSVNSSFQEITGFFGQMQGAASDWLYQDPYDNSCTGQILGYGDGTTQQFQLVRNTGGMVDLMQTALPSAVYINGTALNPGPHSSGNQWYCGIENLLLQSQALGTTPWSETSTTVTNNATSAPDGSTTATELAFSSKAANVFVGVLQTASVPTALPATVTFSVWLEAATTGLIAEIYVESLNAAGQVTNSAESAIHVTTSWTRYSISLTIEQQQGNTVQVQIRSPYASSESAFTIYAWGAQLERWASPSGYNPTTTAVNIPQGLVTFVTAPAAGASVTADFSFWYRCRFLDDQWKDLSEDLYQIWSLHSLKFKSLLL